MAHLITEKCTGCTVCAKICPVKAIAGEKQKLHSINPILCIDCGACGRSCPSSAITDSSGTVVNRVKRAEWLKPVFNVSKCISCTACSVKCPAKCISMSIGTPGGNESFPSLSAPNACVSCGWCRRFCPVDCIRLVVNIPAAPATEKKA